MPNQEKILVVVHPGSALGSADSNLGGYEARAGRDALQYAFDRWDGPVLVIHGELSDEMPSYPIFERAFKGMLARAKVSKYRCEEVRGDDQDAHNQEWAVARWVKDQKLAPSLARFEVTGAWYNEQTGEGCVGSVIKRLRKLGFDATVDANSALCEIEATDDGDDQDDDSEVPLEMSSPRTRSPKA